MGAVDRVRELVVPIVEHAGVELYDIEYESGVLRVMVDRSEGIDVDTIGDLSLAISAELDRVDPIPESKYLLEVTSPGIERRLRLPRHFTERVGERINVKVKRSVEGDRRFEALLQGADATGIDVLIDASAGSERRHLVYDDIEMARLVFDWGSTATPKGAPPKTVSKAKAKVKAPKDTGKSITERTTDQPAPTNKKASAR